MVFAWGRVMGDRGKTHSQVLAWYLHSQVLAWYLHYRVLAWYLHYRVLAWYLHYRVLAWYLQVNPVDNTNTFSLKFDLTGPYLETIPRDHTLY